MSRFPLFVAVATTLFALPAGAQNKTRAVPPPQPNVSNPRHQAGAAAFETGSPLDALPITFRTPGQMTEQDRNLEADAESAIAEHAGYAGLEFNQGNWRYRQIVCPEFPNHLFLRFTRNQGAGDVSVFSASIPRNGKGRVRIIPIERRSYSLFSPAPVNAQTIAAFNRIRSEEQAAPPTPWAGISVCYAALAGANPQLDARAQPGQDDEQDGSPELSWILSLPEDGGAVMRLIDLAAKPRPTEWTLIFDQKGKLIKSRVKAAGLSVPRKVPAASTILPASVPKSGAEVDAATPPA